ncbi:NTP transferase domain-containing protein [Nocardia flavorosea]|uniref:NTP transferase domain-containing protein n=1 Tax=Nocardia flavorosea TaxID=53429 RepID=UPI001E5FE713|nr:NTP transferase domain-containing protein [Nocardia flavorosea]
MPNSAPAPDVIVLAGGRASRMGGVDKPGLVVGGRSMLETALAAAGAGRTVVVGPPRPELAESILQTREPEPGSGPVAAVAAGLAALGAEVTDHVVVLAADMPFLTSAVIGELLGQLPGFDAVFAADRNGRPQYLIGVWRYEALAARLRELGSVVNQPMKALVPHRTKMVVLAGVDDCDTPGDIDAARAAAATNRDPSRRVGHGGPPGAADGAAPGFGHEAVGTEVPEASGTGPGTAGHDGNAAVHDRPAAFGARGEGPATSGDPVTGDIGSPAPATTAQPVTGTPQAVGIADSSGSPLPLGQARKALRAGLSRLPEHHLELSAARGAALAAPITALGALPRFDVSAMDGYAVRGDGPWELRADIGFAGGQRPDGLYPGEAVRIATGAQVPEGTTRVLRDEFARYDGRLHRLPDTPARSDIRRRGEDRTPGDVIAPAGSAVTAALVSAAAAVEVTAAAVRGPVCARIVMTGDEIRSTGPLQAGQIRDSIGPILPVLLAAQGIHTLGQVHLRDTSHGFDQVLATATDCDLLVVVGATGGGAADQLRGALDRAEARILIPRLAIRPGGSTVAAELPSTTTVLGLPGNPFAAVATLLALTPAIVAGRTGAHPPRPLIGPLHNAAGIAGPVTRIVPARSATDSAGGWIGDTSVRTAHLGGLVDRDGVVIVPAGAPDGMPVEFIPVPR